MRLQLMALLSALALGVAGQAAAATSEPSDGGLDGPDILSSMTSDAADDPTTPADDGSYDVGTEVGPITTTLEMDANGTAAVWHCRTAKVAYVRKTLFHFVAYRYWMRRSWCWRYPRVTSVSTTTYVTDNDGTNEYRGVVGSSAAWFTWCCGDGRSGHRAFRQGSFANCIIDHGCISVRYPWIRMAVHGNGTYSYAVGD